jgi:hypothetical protein
MTLFCLFLILLLLFNVYAAYKLIKAVIKEHQHPTQFIMEDKNHDSEK